MSLAQPQKPSVVSCAFLACVLLLMSCLAACSGGSESGGSGGGTGYTVVVSVSQSMVPTQGQTTITATIADKDGPVTAAVQLIFSSMLGGSFTNTSGTKTNTFTTSNGSVTAIYTAPEKAGNDKITVNHGGAYGYTWINVYSR